MLPYLGNLLTMVINHLLIGMILQAGALQSSLAAASWDPQTEALTW